MKEICFNKWADINEMYGDKKNFHTLKDIYGVEHELKFVKDVQGKIEKNFYYNSSTKKNEVDYYSRGGKIIISDKQKNKYSCNYSESGDRHDMQIHDGWGWNFKLIEK